MKAITSFLLILLWAGALAQTNTTPARLESSALPQSELTPTIQPQQPAESIAVTSNQVRLQLDLPPPKPESSLLDDVSLLNPNTWQAPSALNSEQDLMLRYHERLKNAGYLNPTPPPSDDLFSRTMNAMFQSDPVWVGRTTVAFSPITAIKRKNPLALLNPIVLNISW